MPARVDFDFLDGSKIDFEFSMFSALEFNFWMAVKWSSKFSMFSALEFIGRLLKFWDEPSLAVGEFSFSEVMDNLTTINFFRING